MNSIQLKTKAPAKSGADRAQFPAASYFQIHFEHLHTQLLETRRALHELQQQVAELKAGMPRNNARADGRRQSNEA